MKDLVSIIVPAYNSGHFISKTLDNLLIQDVNKEILVVDDGSTDNTADIVNKYSKEHQCIRYTRQENQGVSSARNTGINQSKGDYIVFVDSDDLLQNDILSKCLNHYSDDIDCVLFSYECIDIKGDVFKSASYMESGMYDIQSFIQNFSELIKSNILNCIGTKLYRSQIIKENNIRYNSNISYCEDIGFCLQYLFYAKKIAYINEPAYKYVYLNPNSLMRKYKHNFPSSKDYLHEIEEKLLLEVYGEEYNKNEFATCIDLDVKQCLGNEFNCKDPLLNKEIKDNLRYLSQSKYTRLASSIVCTTLLNKVIYGLLKANAFCILRHLFTLRKRIK